MFFGNTMRKYRLTTLLVVLMVYIFTMSYTSILRGLLSPPMFALLLISLLQAVDLSTRLYRLLAGIGVAALIMHVAGLILPGSESMPGEVSPMVLVGVVLYMSLTALAIGGLLSSIFHARVITPDVIRGSISVYLLLGVFYALFYVIVYAIEPSQFSESFQPDSFSAYIYFSFTTLTTLGYGDISPAGSMARTLSSIEALTGQLYLTIIIARLVGLHLAHSSKIPDSR